MEFITHTLRKALEAQGFFDTPLGAIKLRSGEIVADLALQGEREGRIVINRKSIEHGRMLDLITVLVQHEQPFIVDYD